MLLERPVPRMLWLRVAGEGLRTPLRWVSKMVLWTIRWLLVAVMFAGAYYMWPSVITATSAGRIAAGQVTWLTLGIGLLFYQAFKSAQLAKNTIGIPERILRWTIVLGVWVNVIGNAWEDGILWRLVLTGVIPITPQDTVIAWICFFAMFGVMGWARQIKASILDPLPMFLLAVFSRVIPQGAMIAAERMALVYNTCLGLLLISSQRVAMMGIEVWRAGRKHAATPTIASSRALDAAQWTWWSDIANCLTAVAIFSTWILQH